MAGRARTWVLGYRHVIMISYFRSGPGEWWRFRSDTRYATHTSDYGPEKMIFPVDARGRRQVPPLHPTHLLPRHTSFIMTVIIDYAPTSAPSPPPPPLFFFFFLLPPLLPQPFLRSAATFSVSFCAALVQGGSQVYDAGSRKFSNGMVHFVDRSVENFKKVERKLGEQGESVSFISKVEQ